MIETFSFSSPVPGPHLLFFGAIHGNEPCGTIALNRLAEKFRNGSLLLKKGQVTVVPICNPEAYHLRQRQVDKNLNRVFAPTLVPDCYEAGLANQLTALIDQADVLVDLHSIHTAGVPFAFLDYPQDIAHVSLAKALGLGALIQGWAELYDTPDTDYRGDTVQYAISRGKNAVLVECGQHDDPRSAEVAYSCAIRALSYLGLIDHQLPETPPSTSVMAHMIVHKNKPGSFVRPWKHLDVLEKGDLIARHDDGTELRAPDKAHILLPFPNAGIGAEWYYLGHRDA